MRTWDEIKRDQEMAVKNEDLYQWILLEIEWANRYGDCYQDFPDYLLTNIDNYPIDEIESNDVTLDIVCKTVRRDGLYGRLKIKSTKKTPIHETIESFVKWISR